MITYVEQLGAHAARMDAGQLPPHIVERLRSFLLYNLAMGMAGHDAADSTWGAIGALPKAPGSASVMPDGQRVAAADAAFLNAALITARGQNDTLREIHGHTGCIVIPAVLALAQERQTSIHEVLAALAAGYEVQAHAGNGAAGQAARRGFRATSVFGTLGAAAAAARVIGLDAATTAHALAIACNFAGGVMQCWAEGSMEWRLQVGHASRSGVIAALLAEQGITGARLALEGPAGLYRALGTDVPTLELQKWRMVNVVFKPYPGCAINQGPVFALLGLLDRENIASSDVESVDVHLSPDQAAYPGVANRGPFGTASGAVMSTAFMLAVALRDRALFQRHFTREHADAAVNEQSRMVRVVPDTAVQSGSSKVLVHLRKGTTLSASCTDEENFIFGWEQTVRLARSVAGEVASADGLERIERLAAGLCDLDALTVDHLLELCKV
jgi:2-methylcitrate dehydratase PrpD